MADGLDPVWGVYKDDRAKRIGAGDRSLLGVSAIFGASDSLFTWARSSGLRRLLADEKEISAEGRERSEALEQHGGFRPGEQGTEVCSPRCRGLRPCRR